MSWLSSFLGGGEGGVLKENYNHTLHPPLPRDANQPKEIKIQEIANFTFFDPKNRYSK